MRKEYIFEMGTRQEQDNDYAQMLYQLKSIVEGLLDCQLTDVWNVYGGLNRLHSIIAKIFKHGFRLFKQNGEPDCWIFIQGLSWLQPRLAASPSFVGYYNASVLRSPIRHYDKAMAWLYKSIESHTLSEKLNWLLSDQEHLVSCYSSFAFLRQARYSESMLICLRAVEQNLPSLLTDIDPTLYLRKGVIVTKSHRRCTSYPEMKTSEMPWFPKKESLDNVDLSLASLHSSFISNSENPYLETGSHPSPSNDRTNKCYKVLNIKILESVFKANESETNIKNTIKLRNLKRFFSSNDVQDIMKCNILDINKTSLVFKKHASMTGLINGGCARKPISDSSIGSNLETDLSKLLRIDYGKHGHKDIPSQQDGSIDSFLNIDNINPSSNVDGSNKEKNYKHKRRRSSFFKLPFRIWEESGDESQSICSDGSKTLVPTIVENVSIPKKRSFIEDGGNIVLPMSIGFFPKPSPGQSLISFLSSGIFTKANAELDRENAHFNISEAMITAIEQVKCNQRLRLADEIAEESDEEINELKRTIRIRRRQKQEEKHTLNHSVPAFSSETTDTLTTDQSVNSLSSSMCSTSESISTDTDYEYNSHRRTNLVSTVKSGLSISKLSLYSDTPLDESENKFDAVVSAESVAISLLRRFNQNQLPAASEIEWLVSERDVPHKVLSSPADKSLSTEELNDEEYMKQATLLRGTFEWAPPRPQIIFTQHPPPIRKQLMEKQGYRCAGCGMRVLQKYASKFRYCEYLGRYFCTGCHSGQEYIIPGKVLSKWDFGKSAVSKFSFKLLDQMSTDPLFNIIDLNPSLYSKVRVLKKIRTLRFQLFYLKDYILICKFAGRLKESLNKEQPHILKEPDYYSLQDLIQAKSGKLLSTLMEHVKNSINHIDNCCFCEAHGFICEICNNQKIIFPWDFDHVHRCNKCGSCYHTKCYCKKYVCPKCLRKSHRDDRRNNKSDDNIS